MGVHTNIYNYFMAQSESATAQRKTGQLNLVAKTCTNNSTSITLIRRWSYYWELLTMMPPSFTIWYLALTVTMPVPLPSIDC